MKYKFTVAFLILISITILVYAFFREPHEFLPGECSLCHFDEKKEPMSIKTGVTAACQTCHSQFNMIQSHPTDIYPTFSIPDDMPLTGGKLTCITCHYVHLKKETEGVNDYFLRRPITGLVFCSTCHRVNEKKHIVFENVHISTYEVTDSKTRIDKISLTCIECHDTYINNPLEALGAGVWKHFSQKFNHPVGILYDTISIRKPRNFYPAGMISREIKLFGGKIGCGTCHNIYSKEKFQLVIDNRGSRLCLECHIK